VSEHSNTKLPPPVSADLYLYACCVVGEGAVGTAEVSTLKCNASSRLGLQRVGIPINIQGMLSVLWYGQQATMLNIASEGMMGNST
jgi:hypothetical protein